MVQTGLADRADYYLRTNGVKRLRGAKIGPSEIASSCPRQIVLGREPKAVTLAPDEKLEDVTARLEGTALHRYFQEEVLPALPNVEVVVSEKWIESEYMNGSIDAIIKEKDTGELRILEIKTVKQSKFDEMRDKGEPKPEYIEQMLLYMDHEGIKTGEIFVINRGLFEDKKLRRAGIELATPTDDSMFISFLISLDDRANQDLLAVVKTRVKTYYDLLVDHEQNGNIPEIPYNVSPNAFPCLWCKFKHYCWPNAYQTISVSDMPSEERAELEEFFSKYINAKRTYIDSLAKLDNAGTALKRFFRQHTGLNTWAVNGKNFTIGTDGELYIIKGAVKIDHRIREEAPPARKNKNSVENTVEQTVTVLDTAPELQTEKSTAVIQTKAKRKSPKPSKIINVNQGNLFAADTDIPSSPEEYMESILRSCS